MTKKDMIVEAIESLGYKPNVDEDGDICLRYQLKNIYFIVGEEEDRYISVILPRFSEIDEGEETLVLATCNKVSRDMKIAKIYVERDLKTVSASYEFYYTDMESLKDNVEHSLNILSVVRSSYFSARTELQGD